MTADLALLDSWMLSLHDKSPGTRTQYASALRQFTTWLHHERPGVDLVHVTRRDCDAFFQHQADAGLKGATRAGRWVAMRALYGWMVDEGEIDTSPMAKISKPRHDVRAIPVLSVEQLSALFATCTTRTRAARTHRTPMDDYRDRRDLAILRLLAGSGLRLSELTHLELADVDLTNRWVIVRRGKGGKGRIVRFNTETAKALDRYLRARARMHHAASPALWLSPKGPFGAQGVQHVVKTRAAQAGLGHVHPHQLRHAFAHHFLARGGQEGDLALLGGWDSTEVMRRYGSSLRTERALAAYDQADPLGDHRR